MGVCVCVRVCMCVCVCVHLCVQLRPLSQVYPMLHVPCPGQQWVEVRNTHTHTRVPHHAGEMQEVYHVCVCVCVCVCVSQVPENANFHVWTAFQGRTVQLNHQ